MKYGTIKVSYKNEICFIQMHRPEAQNAINAQMVMEFSHVLEECEQKARVVIVEGLPEIFCFGADFGELSNDISAADDGPQALYDVWLKLARGSFISIAHVRGRVNAGGIGFVAACDLVIADEKSVFSLSELLFGLLPAFVMPFLARRVGIQKASYLTITTAPITCGQAESWGLVDQMGENSETLIKRQLVRLSRISKNAIARHKTYVNQIDESLTKVRELAVATNQAVFSDPENLAYIKRYKQTGKFPWERN